MKTFSYNAQPETVQAIEKIPADVVNGQAARFGFRAGEPLLVIADALLRYARAYSKRYEEPISEDAYCAPHFAAMLYGCRQMLSADGGAAFERGVTTDSKDNGAMEAIFDAVFAASGMEPETLWETAEK